ncbi:MAG: pyruvate kinase [Alphaproteobacteria bacterium]|nr:pyruvate kinase [Alphaproteobacteria bacterium]
MIRRNRQTKIVATLGPASESPDVLETLFLKGVDVFRLNYSHGSHEAHQKRYDAIRALEEKYKRPIAILADMQGPKLRIGTFREDRIALSPGMVLRMDLDEEEGDEKRVSLPHPEVIDALNAGDDILLDDGNVRMRVKKKGRTWLDCEVVFGNKLSNNKGFNIPGVILPITALTEKDRKDLTHALDMGCDWIAQSFVQRPDDVAEARRLIAGRAGLMIKIEKPSALEYLEQMVDLADGVMLARGDLGVEIPAEDVPSVQKRVVRLVRHAGKPIVVATQMLESMVENARPTRAEASDVATAVYDGTDAVMLSAETAVGRYPEEAVSIMDRICRRTESDETYRRIIEADQLEYDSNASDAITTAANQVAQQIQAACITNFTSSGSTTIRTARQRPSMPILCLTEYLSVARRLAILYGVHAVHVGSAGSFAEAVGKATQQAKIHGLASKGQRLVITAGVPFGTPGSTNILRVAWVE